MEELNERVALVFTEDRELARPIFDYLFENAIEYEIVGGAIVLSKGESQKIRENFKHIQIEEKGIISSEELDYRKVQRLRKESYRK